MKTFENITNLILNIGRSDRQLKYCGSGEIWRLDAEMKNDQTYPKLWVVPTLSTIREQSAEFNFQLIVFDLVQDGLGNQTAVLSDTWGILNDIVKTVKYNAGSDYNIINDPTLNPFTERFTDDVSGWSCDIVMEVAMDNSDCTMPINTFVIPGNDGNTDVVIAFGPQGPAGPQGIQGPAGIDGVQGPQGTNGTIGVNGVTGATGSQGPQGLQGATGSAGSNGVTGSQGPIGLQGSQGLAGTNGSQYAVTSGTNSYAASLSPALGSYILGSQITLNFGNTNTGASSVNVNGLGSKNIVTSDGLPLTGGELQGIVNLIYNGTDYQILGGGGGYSASNELFNYYNFM